MTTYTFNLKTSQPLSIQQILILLEKFNNQIDNIDFPSNTPDFSDIPEEMTHIKLQKVEY